MPACRQDAAQAALRCQRCDVCVKFAGCNHQTMDLLTICSPSASLSLCHAHATRVLCRRLASQRGALGKSGAETAATNLMVLETEADACTPQAGIDIGRVDLQHEAEIDLRSLCGM